MSATVESLGISIPGQVVRRHDKGTNRTTLVLNQEQAYEAFNALAPVLQFFNSQAPTEDTEIVDASSVRP